MIGELPTLRGFVHLLFRIPRAQRTTAADIADVLKVVHPATYKTLVADLGTYPLSTVLVVATEMMQVPEEEKPWFFSLVRELHTRSREARRSTLPGQKVLDSPQG